MASSADEADALLGSLRERVLHKLLAMYAVGALVVGGLFFLQAQREGLSNPRLYAVTLGSQLIVLLSLSQGRLGYRRTAILFLGYLWLISAMLSVVRGLTPGTALVHMALLLLASLFFGRRGGIFAFSASALTLAIGALSMRLALIAPAQPALWDANNPFVWLRYGLVFVFFGGALGLALADVIATLQENTRRLCDVIQRERAERVQREAAQKALERTERLEALAQLAGGMAHDFNNNLTIMMSGLELMQRDARNPPATQKLAGELTDTAEVAARSVRELLSLGRRDEARPERVRVSDVLDRVRPAIDRLLPSRMKLEVQLASKAEVRTDPGRLTQALLNLALNARDAMGDDGRLTLCVDECDREGVPPGWLAAPGRFVRISCTDTGNGMDEATQGRIFEPFFTTKSRGQGTGLGLAMVRTAVYDARGFIEVQSRLGRGSQFRLYLPMLPRVAAQAELSHVARA